MADQHNANRPTRDRRRRLRASVVCDGEYTALDGGTSGRWERCSLLDLSLDGAAVAVHAGELHDGQRVVLRLDDDAGRAGEPVEVEAVVMNRRRRTDPNVYGIVFPELSPLEKKQLLRIVITAYQESAPNPG
jgi:c-di-GMP-binding flagellar brake protein YcgR